MTTPDARPMLPAIRRIVEFDKARRAQWKETSTGIPPGELTAQEAAMLLGNISTDAVYDLMNEGRVQHMAYAIKTANAATKRITVAGLISYVLQSVRGASDEEVGNGIERLLIALNAGVLKRLAARIEIILARRENREPAEAALIAYGAALPTTQPPIAMLRVDGAGYAQAELFATAGAAVPGS